MSTTPRATARLQFYSGFTLDDAVAMVPYYATLGVSHIYASPLLKARPGSTHGYDIVDHNLINPEIGGEAALRRLVGTLRSHGMGLIADIVPNHMGVGGSDNAWWLDVLEHGRHSQFSDFFDIDWNPQNSILRHKILAPFLGIPYGKALENRELTLDCDGAFYVQYYEHRFPISLQTSAALLREELAFQDISEDFQCAANMAGYAASDAGKYAKLRLRTMLDTSEGATAISRILANFSGAAPGGDARLHTLLEQQHYRLAWWRTAADQINWRRFFDISTLAGLKVENPRVFEATHRLILKCYSEGLIDGVRIDHIDGLANPRLYTRKLRRAMEAASAARPTNSPNGSPYIVVEKILAPREHLSSDWLTDGTTGYDFMDQVSAVLHDPEGETPLTLLWSKLSGRPGNFEVEERLARRQILHANLVSELNTTVASLYHITQCTLDTRDFTQNAIRRALIEILVHFPVYRIYAGRTGPSKADAQVAGRAWADARRILGAAGENLLDLLRLWLVEGVPWRLPRGPCRMERLQAMVRFQQLSAPTAAKSVEDTAFYRFGRLLSRNEVGSNPGVFSLSPATFHAACRQRGKNFPRALLTTATHDHKRGEDTRARLAVLSEIPSAWEAAITRWMRLNAIVRQEIGPSAADEIMLYQTLVSAWPLGLTIENSDGLRDFAERIAAWQVKALREAKLNTDWAYPDQAYETASRNFLFSILDPDRPVLAEIIAFATRLNAPGAINGLAQTLLRLTTPGVPDTYQGTEFWDQSLVDPDNRRSVNLTARTASLEANIAPADSLMEWQTGAIKQAIIRRALGLRTTLPELFLKGRYVELTATGDAAHNILAFARRTKTHCIITAVTRLSAMMVTDIPLVPGEIWGNTTLSLPGTSWIDVLNDDEFVGTKIPASKLFAKLPVALLKLSERPSDRRG